MPHDREKFGLSYGCLLLPENMKRLKIVNEREIDADCYFSFPADGASASIHQFLPPDTYAPMYFNYSCEMGNAFKLDFFCWGESMMLVVAQLSAFFRRRQTPDLEPNRKRILSRTI